MHRQNSLLPADGAFRGEKEIPLKDVIDDALIGNKTVKKVIVYTRTRTPLSMIKGRDVWWEDEMEHAETQVEKEGNVYLFRQKKWMQKIHCLFYILQAVPANPKAWCILWRLYGIY